MKNIQKKWKKTQLNEYFVIDGDRHVIEPLDAVTKYLERDYQKQGAVVLKDNVYGSTRFLIEGRLYQKVVGPGQGRIEGMSAYRPRGEPGGLSYEEASAWVNGPGKIKDMDDTGIDAALWIPTVGLFIPDILDPKLQAAYARALNNWFADSFCAENRDRLWFAATLPIDPEPARREAERAIRELSAGAVWIRPNVMQGRKWWDRAYDPLWAVLEESGTPLVFHEATGAYHTTDDPTKKFDTYWLAHVISHPQEMTSALVALIGTGILERFPKLKVMFCEAGLSWVPYYLFRMDEHYETRRAEIPLKLAPSEYFRRQCVVCSFEPEEALFAEASRWFKGKNVGATSDYPHWDSGGLETLNRYLAAFPELQAKERADFLQNNLADLFDVRWHQNPHD
jgi:predicted TIM-barrel fold metal-dependent hydrolase